MSVTTMLTRKTARLLVPSDRFLTRVPVSERQGCPVFVTFDDGPDAEQTPRVLDQLAAVGAKATFFLLGWKICGNAALIRRTLDEGHSIGSHGWGHVRAADAPADAWLADADRGIAAVEDVTGQKCRLFRPAYGELTPRGIIGLLRRKMQIVMWTMDVKDYLTSSGDELCDWFRENRPSPGSIVLMHDNRVVTGTNLRAGLQRWSADACFESLGVLEWKRA